MANKTTIAAIALALSGSSIAIFSPPATANPIRPLNCGVLTSARDRFLCYRASLNFGNPALANHYCKKIYGPRAVVTSDSWFTQCDLRTVVDHR